MDKEEKIEKNVDDSIAKDAIDPSAEEAREEILEEEAIESSVEDAVKAEEAAMERLMRLQADFENFKKRTQKEKKDIAQYALEGLMIKLLPILDNLERAEVAATDESVNAYREGVQMVFKQLVGVLNDEGLKEIETNDCTFDPNYHHGVAVGEDSEKSDQTILEVFQKGYTFKDKVIRAAMVKVNQI
ncbi:MAG: nucleotide exchange factor GrpE [Carnobacterium sp.]